MKKSLLSIFGILGIIAALVIVIPRLKGNDLIIEDEENDRYDGPQLAFEQNVEMTKDPALGIVPSERLITAIEAASASKEDFYAKQEAMRLAGKPFAPEALVWTERGSNSDSVGPSNGNTRANGGITSGRIRAFLVDAADATGKTVFIGGINGGLWWTADITAAAPVWNLVNDQFNNLAVSDIFQQPGNPNVMYFATGEGYFNSDSVYGNGVFKSTDHGATWARLAATTNFTCTRLTGDAAGNLYLGTSVGAGGTTGGLYRSIDGGTSWSIITPTGSSARIADLKLSSTGRLHVTTGLSNSSIGVYRFTDSPSTVTPGTWTTATTPFPYPSGANCRVELGVSGNTLYALPSNTSAQVPTIYRSTDGGSTWAAVTAPSATWASGQAWYSLAVAINPADANQVIVGGLDTWKSIDGGATWTKLSAWVGTSGQYVHADQHKMIWYESGNKLLFVSDGGVFFSTDGGTTIRDRNTGLRLKQFYSVAIHPTSANYFLAGAQDNGTHQFNNPGLGGSVEVTGGDGAFVAIDQVDPNYQFGAYIRNQFRRSTNGGASWSSVNFSSSTGLFINPFDYDSVNKKFYSSESGGTFRRWNDPQTGSSSDVIAISGLIGTPSALTVSPYTSNRLYIGTNSGKVNIVDNANTFTTGSSGTDISTGLPSAYVSNVALGSSDSNLMVVFSSYGVSHVWVSTNGGTSWTACDGNLPDMPVRWALFKPGDNTKAYLATEAGVWETNALAGASTVWTANLSFPIVRTDMLKYRSSGGTIAAATHGRGLWTTTLTTRRTAFDYDGDGRSDVSVFRPSNNIWYLSRSTAGFAGYQFGATGDILTPADFTGDGKTDVAVFRPSTGTWFILRSEDNTFYGVAFGTTGDIPAPGDYDGDGKADQAVYRQSQGTWYVQRSTAGFYAAQFGAAADVPTIGDFDGDGKNDIAVYRPSAGQWFRLNSSNGSFFGVQFGAVGDKVVPADYTGDGKTDVAVWRPSNGTWYILRSEDGSFYGTQFGAVGDLPSPGDFDGDGKADTAVYRPADGNWYMMQSNAGFTAVRFGASEDMSTLNSIVF